MAEPKTFAMATMTALEMYNNDYGTSWDLGTNWTSVATDFETYVNKYLFPKINETALIGYDLGNRFDFLAKEVENIAQYSEEYVILDTIPIGMNLSKKAELMLVENFPNMATKLYGNGQLKKTKFTLNNNDVRLNFSTLKDGVAYALGVYKKRVSDINVAEEAELKAMIVDYSLNNPKEKRSASTLADLEVKVFNAILNLQNNSAKYNEANTASGGAVGRFTTKTKLDNICILTTDEVKTYLLDTKLANTFQTAGIDFTEKIISFDDLGGVYKLKANVTIANAETLSAFKAMGDYQIELGDVLAKDAVFTFDITKLVEFTDKFTEVKPATNLYAYVFDIRKLRYRRNTKGMLQKPFENPEFGNVTHWLHYYSSKQVSPFYNSILIGG